MLSTAIFVLLSAAAVAAASTDGPLTGELGNATVVVNNPAGIVYAGSLPQTANFKAAYPDGGNAKGSIAAVANPNGIGVLFKVSFSNLPKEGGPFTYHIHQAPVPEDGNCTATLAHLDPFGRGDTVPCDASLPQTCQVGDLSGKHGAIKSDPFEATYLDQFASTNPDQPSYFGNLSFVLHFANKTRISCANFEKVADASSVGGFPTSSPSDCAASPTSYPNITTPTAQSSSALGTAGNGAAPTTLPPQGSPSTVPVSPNGATRLNSGAAGALALAAAFLFML
ncbi:hypothetical protein VTK73DRAFT_4985 [Phialemonium thermophilum]|uniref:Superoxide dismutase copper/zinc binding domain-containing protein n=1 Tax=Phialemonium thermophilum TaxID=223376 RepID=A0ABR3XYP6_9PEZI